MTKLLYAALAVCVAISAAWRPGTLLADGDAVISTTPYDPPQDPKDVRTATFAVG